MIWLPLALAAGLMLAAHETKQGRRSDRKREVYKPAWSRRAMTERQYKFKTGELRKINGQLFYEDSRHFTQEGAAARKHDLDRGRVPLEVRIVELRPPRVVSITERRWVVLEEHAKDRFRPDPVLRSVKVGERLHLGEYAVYVRLVKYPFGMSRSQYERFEREQRIRRARLEEFERLRKALTGRGGAS